MRKRNDSTWSAPVSKIKSQHELDEAGTQNLLRLLPGGKRVVLDEHGVGVQRVVEIETNRRARSAELEDLPDPQVELIHPLSVQRAGLEDVHGDVGRVAGEVSAERRRHDGVGRRVVR